MIHGRSQSIDSSGLPGDPGGVTTGPPNPPIDPTQRGPGDPGGSGGPIGPPDNPGTPTTPPTYPINPIFQCSANHFATVSNLSDAPGPGGVGPEVAGVFNGNHFLTYSGFVDTGWVKEYDNIGPSHNQYRVRICQLSGPGSAWAGFLEFNGITGWTRIAQYTSISLDPCPGVQVALPVDSPFDFGFGDARPSTMSWG